MIDLAAYLRRVGAHEPPTVAHEDLAALHAAHVSSIPFENIDVRLGRTIRLDLDSLQSKLVARRRGGYCFEHNTLFAEVLRALGFDVATLEARVRPPDATEALPRTHMALAVDVAGTRYLVDVGFGANGPLYPVPIDGSVNDRPGGAYRVREEEPGLRVLQLRTGEHWRDLYAFTLNRALPVDFIVANHFTSTHPESGFVTRLTVQRRDARAQRCLRGRSYRIRREEEVLEREITPEELPSVLRDDFGLDVTDEEARTALGEG